MFYAASQIVLLLLVAAALGGGIGYGIAQARHVNVSRALDRSGAHKTMERDLANARAEIAVVSAELEVANETIRRIDERNRIEPVEFERRVPAVEPPAPQPDPAELVPDPEAEADEADEDATAPELLVEPEPAPRSAVVAELAFEPAVTSDEPTVTADEIEDVDKAVSADAVAVTVDRVEAADELEEVDEFAWTAPKVPSQRGSRGGRRLADRVADASGANGSSAPYDFD
jgi:hypothetical protein